MPVVRSKYEDDDPRRWLSVCVRNCKNQRPMWHGVPEEMVPRVKELRAARRRASYVPVPRSPKSAAQGARQRIAHALYREFQRLSAQAGEHPDTTMALLRRFHEEQMNGEKRC